MWNESLITNLTFFPFWCFTSLFCFELYMAARDKKYERSEETEEEKWRVIVTRDIQRNYNIDNRYGEKTTAVYNCL